MICKTNNKIYSANKRWHHTIPDNPKEKNIYNSLKFFLCFSQCMGMLPQENILKGTDKMHFKWKSWRVLYSFFYIACLVVAVVCCTLNGWEVGYTISLAANQVFYAGALINIILYLRLAIDWSKLNKKWCSMDKIMNHHYGYSENVDRKIRLFAFIYLVVGVSDHILCVSQRYFGLKAVLKENYTAADYYKDTFPELFYYMEFSLYRGIYTSVITIHANLLWAFNDLFIIIMSILLASRFKQISNKLSKECTKEKSVYFWQQVREDYDQLSNLCSDLDDYISYIVVLSYFQNLFFLLMQLYHSLESYNTLLGKLYFIFSFFYVFFKTGSVSLYAAAINDESKAPAYILCDLPSTFFNVEIKRLLVQISLDNVALTGCKMFRITRGLLLSVASAIVTYELVLVQFTSIRLDYEQDYDHTGPNI